MNKDSKQPATRKNGSIDIGELIDLGKSIGKFLKKRVGFIFTILSLLALIYAVFTVNTVLQRPSVDEEAGSDSSKYNTKFNEKTIEKLKELGDRQNAANSDLPGGRINPFSE